MDIYFWRRISHYYSFIFLLLFLIHVTYNISGKCCKCCDCCCCSSKRDLGPNQVEYKKHKKKLDNFASERSKECIEAFVNYKKTFLNINTCDFKDINKEPVGIINGAFYCYQNSLLQCLYYTQLRADLLRNLEKFSKEDKQVSNALADIMCNLRFDIKPRKPDNFRNLMAGHNSLFAIGKAGDTTDLYLNLIDALIDECDDEFDELNDKINKDEVDSSELKTITEIKDEKLNIVNKNLGYCYITKYNCGSHDFFSLQNETFLTIDLKKLLAESKKNDYFTLKECLNHYFREIENNYAYCSKCKEEKKCKSKEVFIRLPKVLVLKFYRCKGLQVTNNVRLTRYLYIEVKDKTNNSFTSKNYELKCINFHEGPSASSGHYKAFCKADNGKYYIISDDSASEKFIDNAFKNNIDNNPCYGDSSCIPVMAFYEEMTQPIDKIVTKDEWKNMVTEIEQNLEFDS